MNLNKSKFSTWLNVFFEITLLFVLVTILFTLFWWLILFVGETGWNCELIDTGLFKSPIVSCEGSELVENFIQEYSSITNPITVVLFQLCLGFPVTLIVIAIISVVPVIILKKKVYKFPVLTKLFLKFLARTKIRKS